MQLPDIPPMSVDKLTAEAKLGVFRLREKKKFFFEKKKKNLKKKKFFFSRSRKTPSFASAVNLSTPPGHIPESSQDVTFTFIFIICRATEDN
jgi:hypothetical protein